jgi:hypothetical protein
MSPTPRGTLDWIGRMGTPLEDYAIAPVYARLPVAETQADPDLSQDPAALFQLPWFDPWFLDVGQIAPWLERLPTGAANSSEAAEQAARDQAELATGEAADALLTGEARARYIHRLEESADILLRRGKDAAGRQALYHARELRSDLPASQIPFARQLVERTLTAALQM